MSSGIARLRERKNQDHDGEATLTNVELDALIDLVLAALPIRNICGSAEPYSRIAAELKNFDDARRALETALSNQGRE